jgi:hypothetical protein
MLPSPGKYHLPMNQRFGESITSIFRVRKSSKQETSVEQLDRQNSALPPAER